MRCRGRRIVEHERVREKTSGVRSSQRIAVKTSPEEIFPDITQLCGERGMLVADGKVKNERTWRSLT
jgi:hypothetical protein